MPYDGTFDCAVKINRYECAWLKYNNMGSFYTGGQAYAVRLWLIAYFS
jgi:hypothetical protein